MICVVCTSGATVIEITATYYFLAPLRPVLLQMTPMGCSSSGDTINEGISDREGVYKSIDDVLPEAHNKTHLVGRVEGVLTGLSIYGHIASRKKIEKGR